MRSKVRGLLNDISFEQDASSLKFRHEVKIHGGKRLFDQQCSEARFELTIDFSERLSFFTIHVTNTEYLQTCFQTFQSPRPGMIYLTPNTGNKRTKHQ